ncbi:hypothetical protein FB390_1840 [Nocardia bhagyanarayanae]|uniref:Uncharacterized protein n=1 Tax=Nocardia bhagyanarayanae TaxID=1215925 RepID=A0A543F8S9_9NOCA|nr:hypothetical protein FB390_1840 [Nocardia bhagyanarayanae]
MAGAGRAGSLSFAPRAAEPMGKVRTTGVGRRLVSGPARCRSPDGVRAAAVFRPGAARHRHPAPPEPRQLRTAGAARRQFVIGQRCGDGAEDRRSGRCRAARLRTRARAERGRRFAWLAVSRGGSSSGRAGSPSLNRVRPEPGLLGSAGAAGRQFAIGQRCGNGAEDRRAGRCRAAGLWTRARAERGRRFAWLALPGDSSSFDSAAGTRAARAARRRCQAVASRGPGWSSVIQRARPSAGAGTRSLALPGGGRSCGPAHSRSRMWRSRTGALSCGGSPLGRY